MSDELNRKIAESFGYTFEQRLSETEITLPNGDKWYDGGMGPFQHGGVPGLRDWQNDISAALELCEAHRLDVHLGLTMPDMPDVPMPGTRYASIWMNQIKHTATGYGETYAEAICRAFLLTRKAAAK